MPLSLLTAGFHIPMVLFLEWMLYKVGLGSNFSLKITFSDGMAALAVAFARLRLCTSARSHGAHKLST